jgi:TolA-binding protein
MRLWSNKKTRNVEFTDEAADETLLAAVENELVKQPNKTFGDLCKEALWQLLYVPESVRPDSNKLSQLEAQITQLQGQLASLEQRMAAREASRLDKLESHLQQLSLQVGQLATAIDSGGFTVSASKVIPVEEKPEPLPPPQEVDPLLSRLGALLDDF